MFDENTPDEDLFPFQINYAEITKHMDLLPITRLTAFERQANPYIRPGDWIKGLPDTIIQELLAISENDEDSHTSELMLLTEMLVRAEGLETESIEDMSKHLNLFISLLAIESLGRKGLVKVYHENMSFGDDMGKKIIVEKI